MQGSVIAFTLYCRWDNTFQQLLMRENAMKGIFLKVSMGPAGPDVRRLDAGTSSSLDSVRLLGQSAIPRMSERCFLRYEYMQRITTGK